MKRRTKAWNWLNTEKTIAALALLATAIGLSRCLANPTPDGEFPQPIPSASIIPYADFETGVANHTIVQTSPDQASQDAAAFAQVDAANQQVVANFVSQNPGVPTLGPLTQAPDGTQISGGVALGDGDFLLPLADASGTTRQITLGGRSQQLAALASGIRIFPTVANQLSVFTSFYNSLPAGWADRLSLPSPSQAGALTSAQLAAYNTSIASNWATIAGSVTYTSPRVSDPGCDQEIGVGKMSDGASTTSSCLGFEAGGLMKNFSFPLKPYLTCIKDQAARGVCHSFAVVSAAETVIARDQQKWVNFSEQDVVDNYRLIWSPGLFHESGDSWEILNDAAGAGFHFAYESAWDFNPSRSRIVAQDGSITHSCDGYFSNEVCSDTVPQARAICSIFDGSNYLCGYVAPNLSRTGYGFTQADYKQIWDASNPELSTEYILMNLVFNNPVLIMFNVSKAFMAAQGQGGYVGYSAADLSATPVGQHAVLIVGYVANTDGASKIPNFAGGSGGGYFIIKNSWGPCAGDSGYTYMPYDYAKATVVEALGITGIN